MEIKGTFPLPPFFFPRNTGSWLIRGLFRQHETRCHCRLLLDMVWDGRIWEYLCQLRWTWQDSKVTELPAILWQRGWLWKRCWTSHGALLQLLFKYIYVYIYTLSSFSSLFFYRPKIQFRFRLFQKNTAIPENYGVLRFLWFFCMTWKLFAQPGSHWFFVNLFLRPNRTAPLQCQDLRFQSAKNPIPSYLR